MRWTAKTESERVDWDHIYFALKNPKIENGEEYIDVTPCEMAAIDKVAEVVRGFIVPEDEQLPADVMRRYDQNFAKFHAKQFAYLDRGPKPG